MRGKEVNALYTKWPGRMLPIGFARPRAGSEVKPLDLRVASRQQCGSEEAGMRTALLAIALLLAPLHGGLADDSQRVIYPPPDGFTRWGAVGLGGAGPPALPPYGGRRVLPPRSSGP